MLQIPSIFSNPHTSGRYWLAGEVYGHRDSIFSVAFSNRGTILASASTDGVKLWDVAKRHSLDSPPQPHRGGATCVNWATGLGVTTETLCFGTQMGYIVVWRQQQERFGEVFSRRLEGGNEITCLATDTTWSVIKIAAGTRDGVVVVLKLDNQDLASAVFAVRIDNTVPSAVAFQDPAKNVCVFGLHNGCVYTLQGTDGKIVVNSKTLGGVIGHAAVSTKRGQFVVDNASDGFDIYDLGTGTFVCNLPTGSPIKRFPKQVAFGEDSKVVVGGSDHGIAYVFDRKTGVQLDRLHHAKAGMVQAVATHEREGVTLITTASAVCSGKNHIALWKSKQKRQGQVKSTIPWGILDILRFAFQAAVVVSGILYLYQNQYFPLAPNYGATDDWSASADLLVQCSQPCRLGVVKPSVVRGGRIGTARAKGIKSRRHSRPREGKPVVQVLGPVE